MESKGSNPSEKSKNNGDQFYFLQNLSEIDNEIMLIERELSKIKMAVSLLKDSPVNSVDFVAATMRVEATEITKLQSRYNKNFLYLTAVISGLMFGAIILIISEHIRSYRSETV